MFFVFCFSSTEILLKKNKKQRRNHHCRRLHGLPKVSENVILFGEFMSLTTVPSGLTDGLSASVIAALPRADDPDDPDDPDVPDETSTIMGAEC